MKTLAENRAASIDLFFEERISQLTGLANTNPWNMLKNEDYLHRVFNIIQARSKSYLDLGVIDQEGNHLAYVGPYYNILKTVNYKNEDWFHAVMSTGVYVSDVFMGFRKIPHFIIAVMVREKNQSWILRATIDSDIIDNIVRAAWIGKKGDAFIINQEQRLADHAPGSAARCWGSPTGPGFCRGHRHPGGGDDQQWGRFPLCHQPHQAQKVGPGDQGRPHGATDPAAAGQVHRGLDRLGRRFAHHHRGGDSPPAP